MYYSVLLVIFDNNEYICLVLLDNREIVAKVVSCYEEELFIRHVQYPEVMLPWPLQDFKTI